MISNKLIDIIDLDNEVDIISKIIKHSPPELIRQGEKMKRDHYRIYFFELETGLPKQVELFAGSFAEAKMLFGKKIKGTFTIQNMTTKTKKEFTIK